MVVSRPSRWGNPFRFGVDSDAATCATRYEEALWSGALAFGPDEVRAALAGRDLLCWCGPGDPCRAEVLLRVANDPAPVRGGARR